MGRIAGQPLQCPASALRRQSPDRAGGSGSAIDAARRFGPGGEAPWCNRAAARLTYAVVAVGEAIKRSAHGSNSGPRLFADCIDYFVVLALLGLLGRIGRMSLSDIALYTIETMLQLGKPTAKGLFKFRGIHKPP